MNLTEFADNIRTFRLNEKTVYIEDI
jgi:hypothetical protein